MGPLVAVGVNQKNYICSNFSLCCVHRGWGNVEETVRKVKRIYQEHKPFERVKPIEGGRKACEGLKRQGYILVIVTSRESIRARETKAWLDAYFPDGERFVCIGA